jgi:membrane protein
VGRQGQDLEPERGRRGPVISAGDFKTAFQRFLKDEMSQRAAALTYYALLSLFPALLVGVSVLGLFGHQSLVNEAANYLKDVGAPPEVIDAVTAALESAVRQRSAAGGALVLGLATALYGASAAFNSVRSALNRVWRVREGRGFVKRKAENLMWTTLLIVLGIVTVVLLFLGGGLAHDVLGLIGLGDNVASVWNVLRWPLALLAALLMYAIVFFAAPNVEIRNWRYITPGAIFGVGATVLASAGFFFYVSSFSSYSTTYGAFAGVVILLIWLNLSSSVLLLGAELNAVIDLRRFPHPSADDEDPVLPPKEPAET